MATQKASSAPSKASPAPTAPAERTSEDVYFDRFKHAASTGEVVGFYDPEKQGRTSVIPRGYKLIDNDADKEKSSVLLVCEVTAPSGIQVLPKKDEELIHAKKGDLIGIWGKVGMRAIADLGNVECLIAFTGERDIGRPKPMKLFEIRTASPNAVGEPLKLLADSRRTSAGTKTFIGGVASNPDADADAVPF